MSTYEVVIAGAGPAGCASAIELANLDASLAGRLLLIDKAVFPRPKLCAGGLSVDTDAELRALGVEIDVPAIPVHNTQFLLPNGRLTFACENQFRVVRRTDFDHALLKAAQSRAVVTREGESVEEVIAGKDGVLVRTSKAEYRAKLLIAADGANSKIRVALGLSRIGRLMIAMEVHSTNTDLALNDFQQNMAVLDLRVLNHGVPGYCWVFPSVSKDFWETSLGLMAAPFDSHQLPTVKTVFGKWLQSLGIDVDDLRIASHPSLRYEAKAVCSQQRVLFVGDAAGVEPLFGEGIVSALAYGRVAARAAFDALSSGDFSFSDYERRVRSSAIGSLMRRRKIIARRLYEKPRLAHFLLKQGALLRGLALLHVYKYGGQITWKAGT